MKQTHYARRMGPLHAFLDAADAEGGHATRLVSTAIYGTRRTPDTNAGTRRGITPASGIGPHSVWEGPRQIGGGAPILKRSKNY
jgi:hypothetical protein